MIFLQAELFLTINMNRYGHVIHGISVAAADNADNVYSVVSAAASAAAADDDDMMMIMLMLMLPPLSLQHSNRSSLTWYKGMLYIVY